MGMCAIGTLSGGELQRFCIARALADSLRAKGIPVATGQFQAHMEVALVNDGPVTILLDSGKTF